MESRVEERPVKFNRTDNNVVENSDKSRHDFYVVSKIPARRLPSGVPRTKKARVGDVGSAMSFDRRKIKSLRAIFVPQGVT